MIGRQALIDSLVQQLPQQRFITLTGAGGIGKTTVALRVAELLIGHYRDGIRLLDLAPLNDPALIVPNLAALLDLTPVTRTRWEALPSSCASGRCCW